MKTYKVKLSILVNSILEINVNANSNKEAIQEAIKIFNVNDYENEYGYLNKIGHKAIKIK